MSSRDPPVQNLAVPSTQSDPCADPSAQIRGAKGGGPPLSDLEKGGLLNDAAATGGVSTPQTLGFQPRWSLRRQLVRSEGGRQIPFPAAP